VTGAWRLALRNLRRNRRRNLVTGVAIALGYAGLLLLGGYAAGVERLTRTSTVYLQHLGHLRIYARGGFVKAQAKPAAYALSPEVQEKIAAAIRDDPRVQTWGRYLQGSGLAGNGCESFPFVALGMELDVERRILALPDIAALGGDIGKPRVGRPLYEAQSEEAPIAVGVGFGRHRLKKPPAKEGSAPSASPAALDCSAPDLDARLGADPWVQLAVRTHEGSFGAADAKVVGWFQGATTELDRTELTAGLDLLQRIYDTDRVTYVAVYLKDRRDTAAVAADLGERLRVAGADVTIHRYDERDANPYYVGTTGMVGAVISFIGLLVSSVAALSVLNAMTLAVLERTREIGTLRSIGFTRGQLLGLFLREATALTALALGAGLALALGAAGAIQASGVQFEPPGMGGRVALSVMPPLETCAGGAALFFVLSLLVTWVAVRRRVKERVANLVVEVAA
jgi:putative ABC transport system permease protein